MELAHGHRPQKEANACKYYSYDHSILIIVKSAKAIRLGPKTDRVGHDESGQKRNAVEQVQELLRLRLVLANCQEIPQNEGVKDDILRAEVRFRLQVEVGLL